MGLLSRQLALSLCVHPTQRAWLRQVLFGYLQVSQKSWCDTLAFCQAFKDYDGTPIRLNEQKVRYSLKMYLLPAPCVVWACVCRYVQSC